MFSANSVSQGCLGRESEEQLLQLGPLGEYYNINT